MSELFVGQEIILPQSPEDCLSYSGGYAKKVLHLFNESEEKSINEVWPTLWKMMVAVDKKITPIKYADMAFLNLKSNDKTVDEVIQIMEPALCFVWGVGPSGTFEGAELYKATDREKGKVMFVEPVQTYEQSEKKLEIWKHFQVLFANLQ